MEVAGEEAARVRQGLYVGSLAAASDQEWLEAHGITHILTVAWDIAPFWPEALDPPKAAPSVGVACWASLS
jgi:hypothetical protein